MIWKHLFTQIILDIDEHNNSKILKKYSQINRAHNNRRFTLFTNLWCLEESSLPSTTLTEFFESRLCSIILSELSELSELSINLVAAELMKSLSKFDGENKE